MIKEIVGDIVRDGKGMICHQVNYMGIMGAGVAYSIRQNLLSPEQYLDYQQLCQKKRLKLLGTNWYTIKEDIIVANMFCQHERLLTVRTLTSYTAMVSCLRDAREYAEHLDMPIYLPAHIGCGIAGGDWNRVKHIIEDTLGGASVPVTIVKWEKEIWNQYDEEEGIPLF